MAVSVLIVDDHPLIVDAVQMTMRSISPNGRIDTAASLAEARRLLESGASWDFVLLDLELPDADGFDGLTALRGLRPDLTTVMLSGCVDRDTILRCIDLGASGYIPKTYTSDSLSQALQLVASGHPYIPREALGRETLSGNGGPGWFSRESPGHGHGPPERGRASVDPGRDPFGRVGHDAREPLGARDKPTDPRRLGLTDRQCDVLRLILRGLPNKLICRHLELAEGTVKVHVSAVLRALGVRNRTQAVIAASRMGIRMTDA